MKNASSLVLPPPKVVCMCPRSRFNQPNSIKILENRMSCRGIFHHSSNFILTGSFLPLSAGLSGLNSCYQSIRHCTRQSFAIQARNSLPPKKNCPDSENHQKRNGYPPKWEKPGQKIATELPYLDKRGNSNMLICMGPVLSI